MGTDAFAFLEIRRSEGGPWLGEYLGMVQRNYRIFDAIAGGRTGDGSYLIYPRGLPPDASKEVLYRTCLLIVDAKTETLPKGSWIHGPHYVHSSKVTSNFTIIAHESGDRFAYQFSALQGYIRGHTWLSVDELEACCTVPGATDKPNEKWIQLIVRMREIELDGASVRFVTWFVN